MKRAVTHFQYIHILWKKCGKFLQFIVGQGIFEDMGSFNTASVEAMRELA